MDVPAEQSAFMGIPLGARPAPTNGWDVVSAVRIAEMNLAIATANTSPKGFALDLGGVSLSGSFGPWALTEESDGPLITLRLPLHGIDLNTDGKTRAIATAEAMVRVRLELLPTGRMRAGTGGRA